MFGTGRGANEGARGPERHLIDEEQLQEALLRQKSSKKSLLETLSDMRLVSVQDRATMSSLKVYAIPSIQLHESMFNAEVLDLVPKYLCLQHHLIPLRWADGTLTIAIADPINVEAIERVREAVGAPIRAVHADAEAIIDLLEKLRPDDEQGQTADVLVTVQEVDEDDDESALMRIDGGPVVRMVERILRQALQDGASDVHWEVHGGESLVRFRVDGHLRDVERFPRLIHPAVVSRIKILAGLDIAETRRPQDGRCRTTSHGARADLRISTVRTLHGEKVVIRVLNKSAQPLDLDRCGLSAHNRALIDEALALPQGMILVTGPTGSGKTTTLYAMLNQVRSTELNLVTIEDPVEYELARVNQIQVAPRAGVTFATVLRTVLRQDPDVVMVGEIRDEETAEIATNAALTGHLVLSSLHTNDARGALTRLLDLGLKPFLVSEAVTAVVAQRLVRRLCSCKVEGKVDQNLVASLRRRAHRDDLDFPATMFEPGGCESCGGTGYKGRLAVHEALRVTPRVCRMLLREGETGSSLSGAHHRQTLLTDALEKVGQGLTTMDEVVTVVG